MILQALNAYYQRLAQESTSDIAPEGFQKKGVPFLIVLNKSGKFVDLIDNRIPSGKKLVARDFLVPKERERSGTNAWQEANLLWDHYGYVLGHSKSDSEADKKMAQKQHGAFVAKVKSLLGRYSDDPEIKAVHQFLSTDNLEAVFASASWPDCKKIPGCNLSFQLEGALRLVCQNDNVRAYVISGENSSSDNEDDTEAPEMDGICLITGEFGPVARLHPRTSLPSPKSKSNAKIVSFQKNMGFDSYGKQQSFNAPVGQKAAFAYTTALNQMLSRDSRQKLQVGDATMVFWAEKKNEMENVFADFFGVQPAKGEPEQDYKNLIALFRSPESGAMSEFDPNTKFYVLGLSPNAARIAVRFWYAGTVGGIADNIRQHFDDLEMVKGTKDWHTIGLRWLLRSTALQEKDENIAPNLAGDTMKAILTSAPYPKTLLAAAVRRCRAEHEIAYTRAALIKAILVRETRFYKRTEKEVSMSLDTTNTNPGYLLGRLFAVLERAQEESARPSTLNATIRDRFYGAASSTPVSVFPLLMKLKNHHIAKLENRGQAVNLEKQIGEIMGKLDASNGFPPHLNLQEQGRFAVGYYHQRQDFFTRKDNQQMEGGKN